MLCSTSPLFRRAAWLGLIWVFLSACGGGSPPAGLGRADRVIDGDSVMLLLPEGRVEARLQGIDAPEGRQAYGDAARQELRRLVKGRSLSVEVTDTDRYGRSVVLLHRIEDDLFVNEELIRRGAAWSHRRYGLPGWRQLERQAKRNRVGLWASAKEPIPPWDFRERNPRR